LSRIAHVAEAAVRRELPGFITTPGYCLAFVFEVIARVYGTNRWLLYSRILDSTKADLDRSRWAVDAERGFDLLNWEVSKQTLDPKNPTDLRLLRRDLRPGDILFSHRSGDQEGHVAIYLGEGRVAENTRANRGQWFVRRSALRITPLEQWDPVTSVGRIPPTWKP
jgi:hypothetical protein